MAGGVVVTCPECEKKFKPKSDVSGKKIKCPFCTHLFVVPVANEAIEEDKAKPGANKSGKGKPAEAKAAPVVEAAPASDMDGDVDPYGIKNVDLVPRCPNCTQEMGAHEIICLACGYNTMTRQWGKTEKTIGITAKRHILYLLPAMGSAVFTFFAIIGLLIFYAVVPYWVAGTWMELLDSEAVRMWTTLIFVGIFWMAGMYCFKKFIDKPKPDEIEMD
jgi:hypothetical protein